MLYRNRKINDCFLIRCRSPHVQYCINHIQRAPGSVPVKLSGLYSNRKFPSVSSASFSKALPRRPQSSGPLLSIFETILLSLCQRSGIIDVNNCFFRAVQCLKSFSDNVFSRLCPTPESSHRPESDSVRSASEGKYIPYQKPREIQLRSL